MSRPGPVVCLLFVWLVGLIPTEVRSASARMPVSIEIPAGLRIDQIGALLEQAKLVSGADFQAKAVDPAFANSLGVKADSLEGYLRPGRYSFVAGMTVEAMLKALVAPGGRVFTPDQTKRIESLGLTEHQAIILASILEKEASEANARARIAAVYLNRLGRGWHLDSPATVAHAHALSNVEHDGIVRHGDFRIANPYNTFKHPGLPPGPICTPSKEALHAALNPEQTRRLVWFQGRDGSVEFGLDASDREALEAVRQDPHPVETTRGMHYVVSNEMRQYHFRAAIDHLGGVWVGVGADQNYTMGGWARPSLLVLMDFDQVIVDLHAVYRVAFLEAESPEKFLKLWHRKNRKRFVELIKKTYSDDRRRRIRALNALRLARRAVVIRFGKLLKSCSTAQQAFFLTDPEQYAHLRELYLTDRVLALRGDLTSRWAMRGLAEVLKQQNRIVRAVYLSNAEQYFGYSKNFRRNLRAQPIDEWSLVLRTRPTGAEYTYILQWFHNFKRWLALPGVRNVRFIVPRKQVNWRQPLLQVLSEPPELKPLRKRRKAKRRRTRRAS